MTSDLILSFMLRSFVDCAVISNPPSDERSAVECTAIVNCTLLTRQIETVFGALSESSRLSRQDAVQRLLDKKCPSALRPGGTCSPLGKRFVAAVRHYGLHYTAFILCLPVDDAAVQAYGPHGTVYHLDPNAKNTTSAGCPMRVAIALTTWVQACRDIESLGDLSCCSRLREDGLHTAARALCSETHLQEPSVRKAYQRPLPGVAGRQVPGSLDCALWAVDLILNWARANPMFDKPSQVSFSGKCSLSAAQISNRRVTVHQQVLSAARRQRMYVALGREKQTGIPGCWLRYPTRLTLTIHSGTSTGNCVPAAISPFHSVLHNCSSADGEASVRRWLVHSASASAQFAQRSVYMPLAVVDDAFIATGIGCLLFIVDHNPTHRQLCAVARVGIAAANDVLSAQGCSGCLVYDNTRRHLTSLTGPSPTEVLTLLQRARQHAAVHNELDAQEPAMFGWLDGCNPDHYGQVLAAAPSLTLAQRGFLAGGDVSSPPSFCRSYAGAYDEDGLAHGEGEAVLLCSDVRLSGEWCAGLPCGSVSLGPDGGAGCFLHVDTELPTSPRYHLSPGLLAPGFLWPRPSAAHNGRRIVTLQIFTDASTLCGQRTYEVSALNAFDDYGLQLIALTCIDQERDCIAGASLPPRVSQGVWVSTQFEANEAIVVYRQANNLEQAITWFGSVQGTSSLPFARQGAGRLVIPRLQSPTRLAVLTGFWWADELTPRPGEQSSLTTLEESPTTILRSAKECRICRTVYSALTTLTHSCRLPSTPLPHYVRKRPVPRGTVGISVHIVGYDGCVVSAFVKQNVSFQNGAVLSGAAGSFAYVAVNDSAPDEDLCFASKCRHTLACRRDRTCPHLRLARQHIASQRASPEGLMVGVGARSLDAFLAFSGVADPSTLPPRVCTAPHCRSVTDEQSGRESMSPPVAAPASPGGAVPGCPDGVSCPDDVSSDGEDSDSGATQVASDTVYGYQPTLEELLSWPVARLRGLAHANGMDLHHPDALRYMMVEYYHPDEVHQVPARCREAASAATTGVTAATSVSRAPKKLGGVRGRKKGDAGLIMAIERFRIAARARRCVRGSMCNEFAHQKHLAVSFCERLYAQSVAAPAAEESNTAEDVTVLDEGGGEGSAFSTMGCAACSDDDVTRHTDGDARAQEAEAFGSMSGGRTDIGNSSGESGLQREPCCGNDAMDCGPSCAPGCCPQVSLTDLQRCERQKRRCERQRRELAALAVQGAACKTKVGGSILGVSDGRTRQRVCAPNSEVMDVEGLRCSVAQDGISADAATNQLPEGAADVEGEAMFAPQGQRNGPEEEDASGAAEVEGEEAFAPQGQRDCPEEDAGSRPRAMLPLTPRQVDEFLYSIQIAKARRTLPVIPLTATLYCVIRSSATECSYSNPGGYSLVTVRLRSVSEPAGEAGETVASTSFDVHCTCSEYRSCRSTLGGRSRVGTARCCTCCLMVVMANALCAPLVEICRGESMWLLSQMYVCADGRSGGMGGVQTPHMQLQEASEQDLLLNSLLEGPRFPAMWPANQLLKWKRATQDLEALYIDGTYKLSDSRPLVAVYPSEIRPLPLECPQCPSCRLADGSPMVLTQRRRSGQRPSAWVFVGALVLRQPVDVYECHAQGHLPEAHRVCHPIGVEWSTATGLFNVANAWFFSILLLEAVTKTLRICKKAAPIAACHRVLTDSWELMHQLVPNGTPDLPNWDVASNKMYDAWYAYELVLKHCDRSFSSICLWCGIAPLKTGSDACAKVAINLRKETSRSQLDYTPQQGQELWSRAKFFGNCHRRLVKRIMWGDRCKPCEPIPVDLVPPIFFNDDYAANTLYNTEWVKRQTAAKTVASNGPVPTTEALLPLAQEVSAGRLDMAELRSQETTVTDEELDILLTNCNCPPKVHAQLSTKAKKMGWLILAYESLVAGTSDCHMHFKVAKGTGGACTLSCPHGVVINYKFLFSNETNRDHADLLRSLCVTPGVHWLDDACGLMTHWEGNYVEEFKKLYGVNRGCAKPWMKKPPEDYLEPVAIPELAKDADKKTAQRSEVRAYAKMVLDAKGGMRTEPHPLMREHEKRLCLTDRMHADLHKKTHRRESCVQNLASNVSSLTHERTAIMESLNARLKEHLATVCTAGPDHAIPYLDWLVRSENCAILERQRAEMDAACPPGMMWRLDPLFGFAVYVCSTCGEQACECGD